MAAHVALLRGINVGGNHVIPMAALATSFESLKFSSVKTFIASGNVIFGAREQDLRTLEAKIERALAKDFAYDGKVVVKSHVEMDAIIRGMPRGWDRPSAAQRYYVIFLRAAVDRAAIVDELAPRAGVETLDYRPGVLYWAAKRAELGKSRVAKLNQSKLYQDVTIRNLNTTRKLGELVAAAARTG
jgi:uncharacterized protein (DUF1697 family)